MGRYFLKLCESRVASDCLQFGIKEDSACLDDFFSVKTTISNFVLNGSSVHAAALDISKAFDCVNKFKLFNS